MYRELNIMSKKKRRSFSRDLRPQTNPTIPTDEKFTNIKQPMAKARFKIGDRVAWDDGECLTLATVLGFTEEACEIKVQLESGKHQIWPTISNRLRRVQTPDYDSNKSVSEMTPSPIGRPAVRTDFGEEASEIYDSLVVDEFEEQSLTDLGELTVAEEETGLETLPDGEEMYNLTNRFKRKDIIK